MTSFNFARCWLLCFVVGAGLSSSAYAVQIQTTTYSYVGANYVYQPGAPFNWEGNAYQQPGTDYAALLGPRLTATITIDGDTSSATGFYSNGFEYNPVGYRGILEASFSSGQVTFSSSMLMANTNFNVSLVNGAIASWSFLSNFGELISCGVGPFCAPGILQMSNLSDYLRFSIPYPGASYGAESVGPGTWSLVGVSPAPTPMLGAGFPGVLLAVAGVIVWRRRRRAVE
jgi:hypothetical protein